MTKSFSCFHLCKAATLLSIIFCSTYSMTVFKHTLFNTQTFLQTPHHAVVVPSVDPHASPCATHLLKRRPPACMWLWIVCHRPALLPPVTMLRTLSLRLGPAPAPEQAPPPPSLAPGEGPAPPCPPLSAAPLIDTVRPTGNKETRTHGQKKRERERERGGQRTRQTYRSDSKIKKLVKLVTEEEKDTVKAFDQGATSVECTPKPAARRSRLPSEAIKPCS